MYMRNQRNGVLKVREGKRLQYKIQQNTAPVPACLLVRSVAHSSSAPVALST